MYDVACCESALFTSPTFTVSNLAKLEINPSLSVTVIKEILSRNVKQNPNTVESNLKVPKEEKAIARLLKTLPILDEHFVLHKKIGEGTYSTVYLASYKNSKSPKQFAIKHLTDNFSLSRIQKELHFMQMMGGSDNVVNVLNCFKSNNKDCVVFIMPYLPHRRFSDYVLNMDAAELKLYMKNLFIALRRVHSFNVIHRDVKPGNFLYCRATKEFLLVDFGLAEVVKRGKITKTEVESENVPINYSKRKRSATDDSPILAKKMLSSAPLQSRENTMVHIHSGRHDFSRVATARSPIMVKRENRSSPDHPCILANSNSYETVSNGMNLSNHRKASLSMNWLKSYAESKLVITPNSLDSTKNFTPLVATVPIDNFVVRNSQVVTQKSSGCICSGTASICPTCTVKRPLEAPRGGTPGFRPPEVLLKCIHQTTAVDMWSAGIVLLCVLSGTYPFFKSPNDLAALMEIITIFGTDAVQSLAIKLGRSLPCSTIRTPLDLKKMCRRRRARFTNDNAPPPTSKCQFCMQNIREDGCVCYSGPITCSNLHTNGDIFPESAYHLLSRLLDLDPDSRITAADALSHPFITQV